MKSTFSYRHIIAASRISHEVLCIYCVPNCEFRFEAIADVIEKDRINYLPPDEILLIVPSNIFSQVKEKFSKNPVGELILARLNYSVPITVAPFDVKGRICFQPFKIVPNHLKSVFKDKQQATKLIHASFRSAITGLFKTHGGIIDSTPSYHFVHPSGKHTSIFFRLSNILANSSEISFLAFCCLNSIQDSTDEVYIDTPALFPILSKVNEIRSVFGHKPLYVESFGSYYGIKNGFLELGLSENPMVFISASSSGNLAKEIRIKFGLPSRNVVQFLYLSKSASECPVICDLEHHSQSNPNGIKNIPKIYDSGNCQLCENGSDKLNLHGDQFDVKPVNSEPIVLTKPDAPRDMSETIGRLSASKNLCIKIAGGNDHFVESKDLFQEQNMHERLSYLLKRYIPASSSHIVQVDDDSNDFAEQIRTHINSIGGNARLVLNDRIKDNLAGQDINSIVVAAVAIQSGQCLTDISRDLREIEPNAPICYLVGVEKSTGSPDRESLKRTLVKCQNPIPHEYYALEKLILPSPIPTNSWERERRLYSNQQFKSIIKGEGASRIECRANRLTQSSHHLTGNSLFFLADDDSTTELVPQPGFVFLSEHTSDYSQVDVFFAISSVLQNLRSRSFKYGLESKRSITNNWYCHTTISPENFKRFNDSVVQASILRAATPKELNYENHFEESRELCQIICRVLDSAHLPRGSGAPEFLLSIATKRLTLHPQHLETIIKCSTRQSGVIRILGKILEYQRSNPED